MSAEEIQRVYVNPDDGRAVLKCPRCGAARTQYVAKFKGTRKTFKVKCKCQHAFRISFEFRTAYRKESHLQGYFSKLPEAREWEKMVVKDLSIKGIGFSTLTRHHLNIGDEVKVRFNLDDVRGSRIEKEAVVKWVNNRDAGCEFITSVSYDETADAALNFYLMP